MQVDLGTPSALTATLRRNLMEFFDENHKEFVPGGGTVIYLDSQDPLKMTLGVVYTFSHNGALLAACMHHKVASHTSVWPPATAVMQEALECICYWLYDGQVPYISSAQKILTIQT